MKKLGMNWAITGVLLVAACAAFATPVNYYIWNDSGGTWADAEKTSSGTDDLMCWAAAASNILEWTGWGKVAGLNNTDQMFAYLQNHWTNTGGFMEYGWEWWFSGNYNGPTTSGWSQPNAAGGGFYPSKNMYDYFHEIWDTTQVLPAIDQYLHSGYGTTLAVYSSNNGHAVTCWGFQYDTSNPYYYTGIYVSDSDDGADTLRYYGLKNVGEIWYLQNFYGTNNKWYIGGVQALAVPEPVTIALLVLGISGITCFKRK
jgi:hypothetical protein